MTKKKPLLAVAIALFVAVLVPATARSKSKRPPRKSPHAEVVVVARVVTAPARKVHANRREFLEFDVRVESFTRAPQGDKGGDPHLAIDTANRVHIVHDLSCGGERVDLKAGDRVEIKGEYVKPEGRGDLIHFTHPADGSCGTGGGHPDGYIRRL